MVVRRLFFTAFNEDDTKPTHAQVAHLLLSVFRKVLFTYDRMKAGFHISSNNLTLQTDTSLSGSFQKQIVVLVIHDV